VIEEDAGDEMSGEPTCARKIFRVTNIDALQKHDIFRGVVLR